MPEVVPPAVIKKVEPETIVKFSPPEQETPVSLTVPHVPMPPSDYHNPFFEAYFKKNKNVL